MSFISKLLARLGYYKVADYGFQVSDQGRLIPLEPRAALPAATGNERTGRPAPAAWPLASESSGELENDTEKMSADEIMGGLGGLRGPFEERDSGEVAFAATERLPEFIGASVVKAMKQNTSTPEPPRVWADASRVEPARCAPDENTADIQFEATDEESAVRTVRLSRIGLNR